MPASSRQGIVPVNGVDLFVDDTGHPDAPPLLYIHGGPGQSCWDFMASQGDRLGQSLRVIGVDQRGVLRSGDVPPSEPFGVDVLIDDKAVLFDCPCWDCDLTDRHRLPVAATLLDEQGKREAAAAARRIVEKSGRITAADESWVAMQPLGDAYLHLFFHRTDSARAYEELTTSGGFSDEDWARGLSHLPLMTALYESQLDLLDDLAVPSVLLHGRDDLVVPPVVVETYRKRVRGASVHTFAESGHFAYHEEPDAYADVVTTFVTRHSGTPVARRT